MAALEARQLADLTFPELSRSLRALSSTYVERRATLKEGGALSGAGKRAAFALFYGPLHFLLVRHIVSSLGAPFTSIDALLDLGCGTGASGAAWATACLRAPRITGVDRHSWAVDEARKTYAAFDLRAALRIDDMAHVSIGAPGIGRKGSTLRVRSASPADRHQIHARPSRARSGVLLAFAVNELADALDRDAVLSGLLEHRGAGGHAIVVEPLAGFVAPWWNAWQRAFVAAGGRADEWRIRVPLPPIVEKLDRAAGLNHRELTGRSLAM
jgi:Methyltransferase domain